MATVTLRNSFHNTEIRVRGDWETPQEAWETIQGMAFSEAWPSKYWKNRLRRIEKALCGMKDCACGTVRK